MNILTQLIERHGLAGIAASMGCTYQAVRKWERYGVPPDRVLQLCRSVDWEVSPHDVRPDIYPNRSDGLPSAA